MHELYDIKEMLMEELKEYGRKGELTSGTLEVVDKLSHAIKNLCKIIEAYEEEEGYSGNYGGSYEDGGSYRNSRGGSYARGGRGGNRGGGSRRGANQYGSYNMGGYSRDHEMIAELRELMQDAPNEHVRKEFERFISKVESM